MGFDSMKDVISFQGIEPGKDETSCDEKSLPNLFCPEAISEVLHFTTGLKIPDKKSFLNGTR
jgi:hypothetical protein